MGLFSKGGVSWTASLVLVLVAAAAGYFLKGGEDSSHQHDPEPGRATPAAEEIWSCSMDPQVKSPKPGLCPICGMDLVPLSSLQGAGHSDHPREIALSERAIKLAEVELATVARRPSYQEIRLLGKVAYDETALTHITAWIPGRIEKLYVDFTGTQVEKGKPLAKFYSPELLVAQQELLQALEAYEVLKAGDTNPDTQAMALQTVQAVREKLVLWGLTPEQVQEIEERKTPSDRITILAPVDGTVISKDAEEGLYVQTGTCLFILSDLDRLWVMLDLYEHDIQWIREGMEADFQVEAFAGEIFTGVIDFMDPVLDETTRTVKLRMNINNRDNRFKPGMFVRAMIYAPVEQDGQDPLVIPAAAALITGKRSIVYVASEQEEGVYRGREVFLGPRVGDRYVVVNGLAEGERVVARGNFKIDSALQLLAKPSMMEYEGDE